MATWANSWMQGEQAIFGWLRSILGGNVDGNAFLGEIPASFAYDEETGMWMFAITGGGTPLDYDTNVNTPGTFGVRSIGATWEGYYKERHTAQIMAGRIMDATPIAANSIAGVMRLKPSSEPSIERGVLEVSNDQSRGGPVRMWKVSMTFDVYLVRVEG